MYQKIKSLFSTHPRLKWIADNFKPILIAVLVALFVRSFLVEPYRIPSGSMVPTLLVGDFVLVNKYAYGYSHYSFPLSPPLFKGRILQDDRFPRRGDVVVFRLPKDPSINYIKRVIGLPGDTVSVRGGILYINNSPVERRLEGSFLWPITSLNIDRLNEYTETLAGGLQHKILEISDEELYDNTAVYVVPEGHYFMMGDNRDDSEDSRYLDAVGFVPIENIVGRGTRVAFSFDRDISIWKPWTWITSLRFDRFFHALDE